jgi:hypothetical protein
MVCWIGLTHLRLMFEWEPITARTNSKITDRLASESKDEIPRVCTRGYADKD